MNYSILVALNDSMSSRAVLDFLANLSLFSDPVNITLLHVFRKPAAGDELMGAKFMEEQPKRFHAFLKNAKDKLVEAGLDPERIEVRIITEPFDTVADGIIDQFNKGKFNMVVIGRKRMSKAEEFVLGDPSIRLVRSLEGTAVVVVKTK